MAGQYKIIIRVLVLFAGLLAFTSGLYAVPVELRNIITIDGLQENPLLGYGLVVGLKGTGDSEAGSQTKELVSRIAANFGFQVSPDKLKPKNAAVVIVSCTVPPLARVGSRLDIRVSSVFDAKSLEGGELIVTPLLGGDNVLYAIAQGPAQVERGGKGVMAQIPQGALLQKEIEQIVVRSNTFSVSVQENLGLDAVLRVVESIRARFPDSVRLVVNNRLELVIPENMDFHTFLGEIFKLKADVPEEPAIIIDSKSGIIVSGGNVLITEAAISFKTARVNIGVPAGWGQSTPGGKGDDAMKLYQTTTTVSELVDGLNQTGATAADIVKILQLLHKNGNLKARLTVQ